MTRLQKARADLKLYRKMRFEFAREGMSTRSSNWVHINCWIQMEKDKIKIMKEKT